jgi:apolipoprotein D and lipocalin family protein
MKLIPALLMSFMLLALPSPTPAEGQSPGEPRAVAELDLERYAGQWFEIARLPNRFQRDCASDVTATYELREDGRINVINRCLKADGEAMEATGLARLASDDDPASKLKVRFAPAFLTFLPFVWADYWVIDLASDYSYAVVGHPDRDYLWVLSRTPQMDERLYEEIVERAAEQGFAIDRLIKTRQTREQ